MTPLLSRNPLWEQFATRTLFMTTYGGADFGECQATMARIAEGTGGHCEATARRLVHQRVYDWLDETLAERART